MKNTIFTILSCLSLCLTSYAQTTDESYFEVEDNKPYIIKKYIGPATKEIVVPKIIKGTTITELKGILNTNNAIPLERLYLPHNIKVTSALTTNQTSLKCAVIEKGTILREYGTIVYNGNVSGVNNISLECILSFQESEQTILSLLGTTDNINTYCRHIGYTQILYSNNSKENIHIYKWSFSNNGFKLTEAGFNYLIWAIKQHKNAGMPSLEEVKEIDLSNVNEISFSEDFNPASLLNYGATVIAGETTYTHLPKGTFEVTDKVDYIGPVAELNTTLSYSRSNTKGWNTVCLPFAINESDFPVGSNTKIYTISSGNHDELNLAQVDGVDAGEPCFIYTDAESWNLTLTNSTIPAGITPKETTVDNTWKMIGSFTNQTIGENHFKLNGDGTMLGRTNSETAVTYPFRCYLDYIGTASAAPERVRVDIDEEETITLIPDDGEPQQVRLYDLMGRPAKEDGEVILRHDNIIIR